MRRLFIYIFLFIGLSAYSQQIGKGYVFDDINQNGRKDRGEFGVANVAISNGVDVVLTNDKGFYSLPVYYYNKI